MPGTNTRAYLHCGTSRPPSAIKPMSTAISTAVLTTTLALHSAPSLAGTCTNPIPASAEVTCSGAAGADMTQYLSIATPAFASGTTLKVTAEDGFGINTAAGNAIEVRLREEFHLDFDSSATDEDITGAEHGIFATNQEGFVSITTSGQTTVTGNNGPGIYAYGFSITTRRADDQPEWQISAGNVTGSTNGIVFSPNIFAPSSNSDGLDVAITTTGTVTGNGGDGIYGYCYYNDTFTIDTRGPVSGTIHGIRARLSVAYIPVPSIPGSGVTTNLTSITTSDSVTGASGIGIFLSASQSFGPLEVTTLAPDPNNIPTVSGSLHGIAITTSNSSSDAYAAREISITTGTVVTGANGADIISEPDHLDSYTTITLKSGTTLPGTSGVAISNNDTDSQVIIETGAVISGDIMLNGGEDNLTLQALSAQELNQLGLLQLDGGGDASDDSFTFAGTSASLASTFVPASWEIINLIDNANVTFDGGASGELTANEVNVEDGSTLGLDSMAFTIEGDLNNNGAVSLQDGAVDDELLVIGNYTANSELLLDAVLDDASGGGSADFVEFQGSVTGTTEVFINNVMAGLGADTVDPGIPLIRTGSVSGSFVLGEEVRDGDYVYELVSVADGSDFVWHLQSSFSPAPAGAEEIPTLGAWAMAALSSLLLGLGGWFSRRKPYRRNTTPQ